MMEKYRLAMKILHKQSEYTDDDINRFQDLIDDFSRIMSEKLECRV